MKYTFVKILGNNNKSFWCFKPKNKEQIIEHWKKYPGSIIREGTNILVEELINSNSVNNITNQFVKAVKNTIIVGQQTMNILTINNIISHVEKEAFNSRINYFNKKGEIYLLDNMSVYLFDPSNCDIKETKEHDLLTYPDEDKLKIEDVKYIKWGGGKHYYAKIGKFDIIDKEGNQKWNTISEAEEAVKWYIENN